MKKKMRNLLLIMLLALTFVLPVKAAEYGMIYDETDRLGTEELEYLGTEFLPRFADQHGIEIRVDVLSGTGEFESLEETAEALYVAYEYGTSYDGNCVSLTLLVSNTGEAGTVLEDWCVYADGTNEELAANGADYVTYILESVLTSENWENDGENGAAMLTSAVYTMVAAMESFAADSGEQIPAEADASKSTETVVSSVSEDWMSMEPQLDHITDTAGILTEEEWKQLETQARNIAEQYEFGVYAITVDDYLNYADGSIFDAALELYQRYSLGLGDDKGGVLLLLSMTDREYSLITYGDFGNYAFNEAGRNALEDFFLDDFADDSWYAGLNDYVTWCGDYLTAAINETPYSENNLPMAADDIRSAILIRIAVILILPLIVAAIATSIANSKMKSVAAASKAVSYMAGELELTGKNDTYTHTTETRHKVESKDSDDDSKSESSGGFSGNSGKF